MRNLMEEKGEKGRDDGRAEEDCITLGRSRGKDMHRNHNGIFQTDTKREVYIGTFSKISIHFT